jgi:hypothetical protein
MRSFSSPDLHNDLPFGPALFEMRKRFLGLVERKYLINHRSDAQVGVFINQST